MRLEEGRLQRDKDWPALCVGAAWPYIPVASRDWRRVFQRHGCRRGRRRPIGPGNGRCSGRWSSGWQSTMTKSMGSSASINSLVIWRPKRKFARL
jgi:hypothetical protein